tara:strand:- start:6546 stop:6728 length:183 start_codon:yes stop_codon:yes gene_type:complete
MTIYTTSWHDDDEGHWHVNYHSTYGTAEKEFNRLEKVAKQKDAFDVCLESLTISKVVKSA